MPIEQQPEFLMHTVTYYIPVNVAGGPVSSKLGAEEKTTRDGVQNYPLYINFLEPLVLEYIYSRVAVEKK